MSFFDLPLWAVESTTLLVARNACGDETTLDVGERVLGEDAQASVADRNPNQVSSMVETQVGPDGD